MKGDVKRDDVNRVVFFNHYRLGNQVFNVMKIFFVDIRIRFFFFGTAGKRIGVVIRWRRFLPNFLAGPCLLLRRIHKGNADAQPNQRQDHGYAGNEVTNTVYRPFFQDCKGTKNGAEIL